MIDNNNEKNNLDQKVVQDSDIRKDELLQSFADVDNVIDPKDRKIIQLEIELAQIKEQGRETILRLHAEMENVRRRSVQEIEKIRKFSLERFVFELLSVIDNLERTLSIVDRSNVMLFSVIEGIELTLKSFLDTMYKFGVKSVDEVDVPFNPEIHQAMSLINSEKHKANQVLTIVQKGYLLNGRLIRPAMVMVSKE